MASTPVHELTDATLGRLVSVTARLEGVVLRLEALVTDGVDDDE
jgi:hypothetical protein